MEAKFLEIPPLNAHKLLVGAQICWRMVTITTAFAATWMAVTSKESVSYSSAFMFLAFANPFACGFTFLFLLSVFLFRRRGLTPTNHLSFLHDLFLMLLMLSGVAAGTVIGYVGRFGDGVGHAGWSLTFWNKDVYTFYNNLF
ncbi:CASP-like protein 1F1 [Hibiscus trionum]|uniref:CASP-like protein n=1 Tax=Hibiscus trionum TaxID=183268 RepID=A0A9W7IYJ0_HIBTR|nr:CASP-like protein 1F1 [Hibiscus trionum]